MNDQPHGPPQPQPPQPPEGMQRPGIPGAGNLLDPEVRGDLREQFCAAVQGARQQMQGAQQRPQPAADVQQGVAAEAPAQQAPSSPPTSYRAGPFPHGDVDLRGLVPNVLPGVRPQRGVAGRRFYFLREETRGDVAEPARPAPPGVVKPG